MTRIPLSVPDMRGNETAYLQQCVETNWVSSVGSFVTDLEDAIATHSGAARGVAIVNGTCALELALRVAGVGRDDIVIIPDWTFVATPNAVCHAGAKPHFVDVSAETWTMDPDLLEQAIGDAKGRVAAIVPVHALGHPADMDPILAIADSHGIPVVEDAAGAIGSLYKGDRIGSLRSKATMFSFNGNKLMTCGSGGMIVTDDVALADHAKALSSQARRTDAYIHDEVAFNYRMSNVNAAIGLAQFERIDQMLARRKAIAEAYRSHLEGSNRLRFMPKMDWADPNGWLSAVHCASTDDAAAMVADMDAVNIDARLFWESLSAQPPFADCGHTLTGVSRELTGRMVTLPCSSSLDDDGLQRVLNVLEKWR